MRSILVPASPDEALESRLEAALDIARACNGHITFLHAARASDYVALDPFGGSYYVGVQAELAAEEAKECHDRAAKLMASEDVAWDFIEAAGNDESAAIEYSRLSDLIVLSEAPQWGDDDDDVTAGLTHIVMSVDCPILAVPEASKSLDCFGRAVVAWNGSAEAAGAMRAAMPLLRHADQVEVVTIGEDPQMFPGASACQYLSRHGVKSEFILQPRAENIAGQMTNMLIDRDAAYLVMGAYGHSRVREFLFGGMSRHFLRQSPVPVFLTH